MENEQTDKTKPVGDNTNSTPEENKPLSLYDKTEALVTRQENELKERKEVLDREEKLFANQRLAGTGGGHVETKPKDESDKDYRKRVEKEMAAGKTDFGN